MVALASASTRQIEAAAFTRTASASSPPKAAFAVPKTTASATSTNASPPPLAVGTVYHKTVPIPVLGRQSFRLHILSDQRAHLRIDGMLQADEVLHYQMRPCGAFSLTFFPERLQNVLRRFRTKLVDFGFDRSTDSLYVVVSPPLPTKIRIQLDRQGTYHNTAQGSPVASAVAGSVASAASSSGF